MPPAPPVGETLTTKALQVLIKSSRKQQERVLDELSHTRLTFLETLATTVARVKVMYRNFFFDLQ